MAAGQAQSSISHRVTTRWASELESLEASWRLVYAARFGERVITFEGIRNIGERDRELEIVGTEGDRTE